MIRSRLQIELFAVVVWPGVLWATQLGTIPRWALSPKATAFGEGVEPQRIAGMARLGTGHVVVANGATFDLKLFDPGGKLVATVARQGAGPGEFQFLSWVGRRADTLVLYDSMQKRITEYVFSPGGRLGRIIRATATGDKGSHFVIGQLDSGRWLVTTGTAPHWDIKDGQRDPTWLGTIPSSGDGEVAWLGQAPGLAMLVHKPNATMTGARLAPVAFSPGPVAVAAGSTVWIGDGATSEIRAYRSGDAPRTIHLAIEARPVTPALAQAAKAEEQARWRGPDDGFLASRYSAPRLPKALPVYQRALAGPDGEVWIEEFPATRQSATQYLVIDSNGAPRARVTARPGFRIHEIGTDYALGIWHDGDDVEHVHLHHLDRGGP